MPRRRRSSLSGLSESRDYDTSNDEYANEQVPSRGKPQQRNAANARERARMRVLSKAFGRLKTKLPWVPPDTKLSKLDTLRLATSYISHLQSILKDDHFNVPVHPRSLLKMSYGVFIWSSPSLGFVDGSIAVMGVLAFHFPSAAAAATFI
ncbi:transcription factor 21 isoform X2 [Anabrus simplex]|uniref:transcription factor 21 isoform X2 n=1 Tax=Anabrus simplex TaxID=316456 RepID=UPI0034DD5AAF